MPHSPDLIQMILALVERDYPPGRYRYVIEKYLPGTRMAPDITVFGPKNETLCVVEIGYTRPEKLTAYRHIHRIADVRWYDKTGTLHGDVQEKSLRLTVTFDTEMEITVYYPMGIVSCFASDCFDGSPDLPDDEMEQALDNAPADVGSVIVTDDSRAWIFNSCDKCGDEWLSSNETEDDGVKSILDELREGDGHSHAALWGARQRMPWAKIKRSLKEIHEFDLVYEDGLWLFSGDQRRFNRQLTKLSR